MEPPEATVGFHPPCAGFLWTNRPIVREPGVRMRPSRLEPRSDPGVTKLLATQEPEQSAQRGDALAAQTKPPDQRLVARLVLLFEVVQ
jgi:hypothetical protein